MMKMIVASAALAAFAAPAFAQQPTTTPAKPKSMAEDMFTKHDTDKNGGLSIAEVKVVDATAATADFDTYDADKDKALSKAEFAMRAEAKTTPPASAPGE